MKKVLLVIILTFLVASGYAQDVRIEKAIPSGINTVQSPLWGNDVIVSNFEPIGPITAIKAATGTIYVAINDTLATANLGLIIMQSTNDGNTWSLYPQGITLRTQYTKLKLISAGGAADSVYLFFQVGSSVYSWNFRNQTFNSTGYGNIKSSFDVVGAANGSLYYFFDTIPTSIRRYSSIDGGLSWINRGLVGTGVKPKIETQTGDTIILNYYGPVLADTVTSIIRSARYRQTAPGVLTSSNFQDVAIEIIAKTEFKSVMFNGVVWFIYTSGTTGAIDIKGRISTNGGANYDAAIDIAANPNVDEYWFDANFFPGGGFDLSYYSDSLQAGAPTNNTDKMMYRYALVGGTTFGTPTQISSNTPTWSANNYKPVICEIPPSDIGIVWVGVNAGVRKLYWDRYSAATNIGNSETPVNYSLSQNYPNPFNPTTKINFNLAKNGFVTLKVYNILGKEVAKLVSGNYNAGSYSIDFNANKLSSGAYFYSIEVNGFKDIKKMMLVK